MGILDNVRGLFSSQNKSVSMAAGFLVSKMRNNVDAPLQVVLLIPTVSSLLGGG